MQLPIVSQISSRSLPMSLCEHLTQGSSHPSTLYASPTHTATPYSKLLMCDPHSNKCGLWQMASEHEQKASQICGPCLRNLEAVNAWPDALQHSEKTYQINNSSTRGSKKHEANIPIESLKIYSIKISSRTEKVFLSTRQLVKTRGDDCYSKCEDSNTKLQET